MNIKKLFRTFIWEVFTLVALVYVTFSISIDSILGLAVMFLMVVCTAYWLTRVCFSLRDFEKYRGKRTKEKKKAQEEKLRELQEALWEASKKNLKDAVDILRENKITCSLLYLSEFTSSFSDYFWEMPPHLIARTLVTLYRSNAYLRKNGDRMPENGDPYPDDIVFCLFLGEVLSKKGELGTIVALEMVAELSFLPNQNSSLGEIMGRCIYESLSKRK
ncbi:MAG TPA: hypothetical protein P5274_02025 [Candidatus Paceibacterota bacterium]|nr:hypothetical protein [Candidatus Paceibacterota bacterium]